MQSTKITRGQLRSQKGCRGPMGMIKVPGRWLRSQEVLLGQPRSFEFNLDPMKRLRSHKGYWVP